VELRGAWMVGASFILVCKGLSTTFVDALQSHFN